MKNVVHIVGCVAISVLLAVGSARGATKEDYCVQPAFIATGLEPNLLLMIDNSASMYDLAYTGTSSNTCYDSSYDNTADYIGYFSKLDSEGNVTYPVYQYSYNSTTPADSKFIEVASVPTTGGTYRTSYLYIEMIGTKGAADRKVSSIIASGRFLNWLSASKFDTQKQVLTGGKYDTGRQLLTGESRGCVGRRFVREILPSAWTHASLTTNPITFAVRGPNAVEPLYNPDTQGGETRIEIYEADFNQDACNSAAQNWIAGNYGTAQTQTGDCLDISGAGNTAIGRTLSTFNHTMQTCWQLKDNIRRGATTADAIWQGINITDVTVACEKVYTTDLINPVNITNASDGKYVCTSAAIHLAPIAPWNVFGSDVAGYLGLCWKGTAEKFIDNDDCVKRELLHYCMGQEYTEVIDPSSTATTGGGIPAVLIDAGVRAIGNPIGPVGSDSANTFLYAHAASTPPSGLLQKYGTSIRIGAMSFNNIGSASETMPGTVPATNKDAGKIISFIGDPGVCSVTTTTPCSNDLACPSAEVCNFAGSHSAGLVNAVDGIVANTWTPLTEAYYNAIGYYVKDALATNSSLSSTKFTPSSAAIVAPLTGTDSYTNKNPILARCQSNYIMLISDGGSTADQNSTMATKVIDDSNFFRDPATLAETGATSGVCGIYKGSPYLHDLSYFAKHRNIFQPAVTCASGSCDNAQTITTLVVYTGPATSSLTGVCDPKTQMTLTATNGGTTLYTPSNPTQFFTVLRDAFSGLVARAASGTAASILSNSEGSGANILQAVFFPKKYFDNETSTNWIGEMLNLWYYVDPYINNSTIREDTDYPGTGDHFLNLKTDYVARFTFDSASDRTMVQRYSDDNGDGTGDTAIGGLIDPDDVKTIWRAGRLLWERDISASPRKIYTPMITGGTEITGTGLMTFTYGTIGTTTFTNNSAVIQPYLQYPISDPASTNNDKAVKLMQWVHGFDFPAEKATIRNRTVKKGNIPAAALTDALYVTNPRDKGIGVWKLGDIISSTPRLQSTVRLNTYDLPKPGGYNDKSYESYAHSNQYANRGMVYVGVNDGMLHAFNLGILSVKASGFQKASLTGTNLGKEEWSFIPKNFLPYLKYLSEPAYAHQYSVDGRTVIFDASIGDTNTGTCIKSSYWECDKLTNSSVVDASNNLDPAKNTWRTIVIGGMGLGGASRSSCTGDVACVQTPMIDPADTSKSLGYSSYFALDVTDPLNPKLLWEFNHDQLGFATTGPAIVRVGPANKNGRWFAVFGNGPFGKIEAQQFKGNSDHHLRFFIVDLRTGVLVKTITTDIDNAFAGAMLGGSIDADRWDGSATGNYQDDAIYIGYTKEVSGSWTGGGVGRLMIDPVTTGQPDADYIAQASNFKWSKVLDDIGPVTNSIARLQDKQNKNLWLFFGTGRYFYRDSVSIDDRDSRRALFGIKEPCYNTAAKPGNYLDPTCTAAQSGTIVNQTSLVTTVAGTNGGWRIDLDNSTTAGVGGATTSEGAERVVTDTVALTSGSVFFTTFKPSLDICGYGGNSFLWGVKYTTGGQAAANALQGKALIQLSSGEFKEVNLATAFTDAGTLNRRMTTPMTGKPPSDAPPIVTNSQNRPLKKILHIKER